MSENSRRKIKGRKSIKESKLVYKATENVGKKVETAGKGVQATGKGVKAVGKGVETAGKGMQVAGKGMQAGGKAIGAAGDALTSAGTALSSTGVGALLGVPLTALGAGAKATGAGMDVAGKGTETAGKGVETAGKTTKEAGNKIDNTGKQVSNTGKNIGNIGKNLENSINGNNQVNEVLKKINPTSKGSKINKNNSAKAKQQIKKKLKLAVLKIVAVVAIIVILASAFLTIVTSIKEGMVQLLNSAQTRITSFWKWFTDDEWIKLDKKIQYEGEDREYTIVEKYVKDLVEQGISLKELRLLGDFEFSEEDQKLTEIELIGKIILNENGEYTKPKNLIEKYISEFVRADLITQSLHRRRGTELVATDGNGHENEDWIDGGIYLYRAKNENELTGDDAIDEGMYQTTIDDIKYVQMEYMQYDKFMDILNNQGEKSEKQKEKLRYKYTVDTDTGELIYVQLKTVEVIEGDISNTVTSWFENLKEWLANKTKIDLFLNDKTVELTEVRVDYKQYISKYSMPYEFLVNLCMITQNPEFVYHVALLARDTKIVLAIQDDETIEQVTTESEKTLVDYKNDSNNKVSEATASNERTEKTRKVITTTTMNASNLRVKYANSWSFYEEFEYENSIEFKIEPEKPVISDGPVNNSSILANYSPPVYEKVSDYAASEEQIEVQSEYWYENGYVIAHKISTQTEIITNTYKIPDKPKNSIEKSKRFLGLLRNDTGECPYDCYKETSDKTWNYAKQCAEEAVFDESGINVTYQIPNIGNRKEAPLNKLTSGLQMLYQLLGENGVSNSSSNDEENGEYIVGSNDSDETNLEEDLNSTYNQRMQGVVEHLKYLMTFPENEEYDVIDDVLVYVPNPEDEENDSDYVSVNVEDIIVKTDEPGAAPEVTRDELITAINNTYSSTKKIQNAISLVDTLIDGQKNNKVNPIFMLAVLDIETGIGIADSSYVKNDNNWSSYYLGKKYDSPNENLKVTINAIANGDYYFSQGKYTIRDIGYTYCPNTDDYPHQGDYWVLDVTKEVRRLYSKIGVEIEIYNNDVYTSSSGKEYMIYIQQDYPNVPYYKYADGHIGTVSKNGCSIASVSTVLSGYGVNKDPGKLLNGRISIKVENLISENGISQTRIGSGNFKSIALEALNDGRPVIIHVNSTSSYTNNEHWMPILDIREIDEHTEVYVANPNRNGKTGWNIIDNVFIGCEDIIVINE